MSFLFVFMDTHRHMHPIKAKGLSLGLGFQFFGYLGLGLGLGILQISGNLKLLSIISVYFFCLSIICSELKIFICSKI